MRQGLNHISVGYSDFFPIIYYSADCFHDYWIILSVSEISQSPKWHLHTAILSNQLSKPQDTSFFYHTRRNTFKESACFVFSWNKVCNDLITCEIVVKHFLPVFLCLTNTRCCSISWHFQVLAMVTLVSSFLLWRTGSSVALSEWCLRTTDIKRKCYWQ